MPDLDVGGYYERAVTDPKILAQWSLFLVGVLSVAPQAFVLCCCFDFLLLILCSPPAIYCKALVHFNCLKKGFLLFLEKNPRLDPFAARPNFTAMDSAEELAGACRRMMRSLANCKTSKSKRQTAMRRCSNIDEEAAIMKLVDLVKLPASSATPSPTETSSAMPSSSALSIDSAETINSASAASDNGGWMTLGDMSGSSDDGDVSGGGDLGVARPSLVALRTNKKKILRQNANLDGFRANLVSNGWEIKWSVRSKTRGGFWTYKSPDGTVYRSVKTLRRAHPLLV